MQALSVLIPSRNEMFLRQTIENVLENIRGKTEIIAVLDGTWADPPIEDYPNVHLIYHSEPIGQRAAVNEAAKMSTAKFIMKLDAHCSVGEGFDVKLMEHCEYDWTVVPRMFNLHAFDWKCNQCRHHWYQGPTPTKCEKCDNTTDFEKEMIWKPKKSPETDFMRFDCDLRFQYWSGYKKRPEAKGDICDLMSCLGACWFMHRNRFWELGGLDEAFGSWGQMGTEISVKSWTSGGRMVINKKTWFSHMFRGRGDFGFPYKIHGSDQRKARERSRDLYYNNKWEGQIRPLSWIIKKFKPIPDWHDSGGTDILARITKAGAAFSDLSNKFISIPSIVVPVPSSVTNHTTPMPIDREGQEVPVFAMRLPSVSSCGSIPLENISGVGDKLQMGGITTKPIVTNMIENGDVFALPARNRLYKPSIHEPVNTVSDCVDPNISVARAGSGSSPEPTTRLVVNSDLGEDAPYGFGRDVRNNKHLVHTQIVPLNKEEVKSKGIIFYTDNQLKIKIAHAVQKRLRKISQELGTPIVSASLRPMSHFGAKNVHLKGQKRGYLTMFRQILAGLEASDAEIIFFCEHDCLYHPSHFDFVPPKKDVFYYNENCWKVDSETGRALFYFAKQTSGLCAYHSLLVEHYRKRIEIVEREGFTRRMGFEPGTHGREERVDDHKAEAWMSEHPNIDIRHGNNLTPSRWSRDEFRNQKYTRGWTEADEVPGWGVTKGRFKEFLGGR